MVKDKQIVITGASGFVAKNLRKHLSENNFELISISRKNFRKFKNEQKIISKNYNEKQILSKIRNSDVIFHLVGVGRQSIKNDYDMINVEFTKHILNLSKKAKIKKFIFTSGLGVSTKTTSDYFISKYKAEKLVINSGLNYTIFRPSYIVGKDDLFTKHIKKQIRKKKIIIPGSGKYSMQPIYINDVTKVFEKSIIQNQFRNQIIDLVGPQFITFEKYMKLFSKGTKTIIKKIELEHAYHEALTNPKADFGIDDLNILVGDFKGNHSKLRNLSKIKFESVLGLLKSGALL